MAERANLGAVLKRYRMAAGLSQEALAARSGLSARAISDLERDLHRTPHAATLDLLSTALSLSAQQRAVLLAAAHPELDSATTPTGAYPKSLPLPPTALIGRERECDQALSLLRHSQGRLLTLTGPSGVGKTRLALQLAHELTSAFADGATLVSLAPIRDAALVPSVIAQALGLHEQADISLAEQVCSYLQGKQLLLVLDNFEHLLEVAPFVADLLARCSQVVVLVTSRMPLRLRAERTLPLAPLSLAVAVTLFRERVQAVQPDGAYDGPEVTAICECLDCLPLAIELAAARAKALSIPELLANLTRRLALLREGARDLPARQRTMADAIGWSYELLTEAQQRCFRALGVFAGGWTLEAATAVCWRDEEAAPSDAILTLAALVDASLIQAEIPANGAARFRMLELIHEYAVERLRDAGEEEIRRRYHTTYYARLADMAVTAGMRQSAGDTPLFLELPNARAALEWAEKRHEAELGLRLTGFARLWHIRGQIGEAEQWLERMLALDAQMREQGEPVAPLTLRIERLYGLGRVLLTYGKLERAGAAATEAIRLAQRISDEPGMSAAFATLGMIAQASGKLEQATAAFTESYAHARLAEQNGLGSHALTHLAELARLGGDTARAYMLLEEALVGAHASGNSWDIAIITTLLGQLAHQQGRYAQARARYRESLPFFHTFGSPTFTAWCLESCAATLCAEKQYARATRLCAVAAALREQAQTPLPPAEREAFDHVVTTTRALLGESAFHAEWAMGATLSQDEAIATALSEEAHDPERGDARA